MFYIFEIILKILNNVSFYGFSKYCLTNKDLNYIYDFYFINKGHKSILDNIESFYNNLNKNSMFFKNFEDFKPYWITGLSFIDKDYLNPYHKRVNDSFFNHFNYERLNKSIMKPKNYEVGFKSFISFILPYLDNLDNLNDYYQRLSNYNSLKLKYDLNETFKQKRVFKLNLNEFDLEKIDKTYLLFKNDLKIGDLKINIVKYDEFIKNIKIKSNYNKKVELDKNFFDDYKKYKFLFNSFIIICEKLNHDGKNIFIYLNKNCYHDLLKTINNNNVRWFKSSNSKLLKQIRKNSYHYLDNDDKREYYLKQIKKLTNKLKKVDKKTSFYKKELDLLHKHGKTNSKYLKEFDKYNNIFIDISIELDELNTKLIELDKKDDIFKNNLLDYSKNISLELKTYLD